MSKEQWIEEIYVLMCGRSKGALTNADKEGFRKWSQALSETEYFEERLSPIDALDEEMSHYGE